MKVETFSFYLHNSDQRGVFIGITNTGIWREANFVRSYRGAVRGGHYHKHTHELIYILTGEVEIELRDIRNQNQETKLQLVAGYGIKIEPLMLHTLRYLTDCEQLSLLDQPFDPENPDLHTEA